MGSKKAKNIMIMGTMSGAGKSLITTALCRIFKQDGYKTAPFKSQNMALNSHVTAGGFEIGRAQAVQAEAAGIEADSRMNPILLKPTSDRKSQVILNGRVYGNYEAGEYYKIKNNFVPDIMKAYGSLESEYDIIVIEGAGSPAEINLKEGDIVNMGLAEMVNAPVLLAGNIDPGGVFAQLYGTVGLLNDSERQRIRGLIINKFRGDIGLLRPGIEMIEKRTGISVIGTLPYMDIRIDEEDSLTDEFKMGLHNRNVDVAVVKAEHISNFTDIAPLKENLNIGIRYVSNAGELCKQDRQLPDIIIVPGSKSTMEDLIKIRENGLEDEIKDAAKRGCIILGICGGFQMLGESISDPEGIEGDTERIEGMGLLPVTTCYENEKVLRQVRAQFNLADDIKAQSDGYEIHMGRSRLRDGRPFAVIHTKEGESIEDGAVYGNVYGTYLHGLFDSGELTDAFLRLIAKKRRDIALTGEKSRDIRDVKEEQYDLLADIVRKNMDINKIYEIMDEA